MKPITGGPKDFDATQYKPNHYLEPQNLFANSPSGRTHYDGHAEKRYAQAVELRKVGGSEARNHFLTQSNMNPQLSHIHNRKVEINTEKKDQKITLGTLSSLDDFKLKSARTEMGMQATGRMLASTNNYLSQIGKDVKCDRVNVRRTLKDYDVEQPNYMRVLEN